MNTLECDYPLPLIQYPFKWVPGYLLVVMPYSGFLRVGGINLSSWCRSLRVSWSVEEELVKVENTDMKYTQRSLMRE